MENTVVKTPPVATVPFMSAAELLDTWQGHRRLSRRVLEAFPEDQLTTFSIGGMRPYSQLAIEMIALAAGGIEGVATGNWDAAGRLFALNGRETPVTRQELLDLWDQITAQIDTLWPQIPAARFQEKERAFGQYEGVIYSSILYLIDNEIHHRGQGYVYLRALGIAPPPFWDRQ